MEDDKLSITRVQLFAWTWITLFVYLVIFFLSLGPVFANQESASVSLPNINPNLLVLSGISQAGFIVGKVAIKPADQDDAEAAAKPEHFSG